MPCTYIQTATSNAACACLLDRSCESTYARIFTYEQSVQHTVRRILPCWHWHACLGVGVSGSWVMCDVVANQHNRRISVIHHTVEAINRILKIEISRMTIATLQLLLTFLSFLSTRTTAFSVVKSSGVRSIAVRTRIEARRNQSGERVGNTILAILISASSILGPDPALADGQTKDFRLPPIDFSDKTRCQFSSSKMGQANAARDKLYDLRMCNLSGKDASGFDLSGVIMDKTDVSKAKFVESQFSKAYLHASNFDGADFTNGIVDRANFAESSLRGAIFKNTVLTGTTFDNADLEGADFSDSYLGGYELRGLCKNPTLKGENPVTGADTKASAGCLGPQ